MQVGDLVRGAFDKDRYRTGIIVRIALDESWGEVAHVLWTSTPVGLSQTGPAWVNDLEKL